MSGGQIDTVMQEGRVFPPPAEFAAKAQFGSRKAYEEIYERAKADPEKFWGELAKAELHWFKPFGKVLEWKEPFAKWFVGGQTNVSYNCLDAHLTTARRNKAAFIWEGEPGEQRTITYAQLHREVCKFANVLKSLGLKQGDVATIYMPMVPELAIAMLACARIGVVHSVVFGGFSAEAIADRNNDAKAKVVITADGGWRRGKLLPLKETVDEALAKSPTVQHCVVYRRAANNPSMKAGRDHWWHELMEKASADCPAEPFDSETPLFILYTSGSTGKPKGIKHTTAGYNLFVKKTFQWVFDYREEDIFWCTADIGWVTGHSYVVYGPMANGATAVMYEGAPNFPEPDRFWRIIEKYGVTILYTAPTAIRAFMKWGTEWPKKHNLSSLRLLGTVGEPINPEAWIWYHETIGGKRCPIVDTWWQTETGGILISPLPGATPTKPGSATLPFFGIVPEVVDDRGDAVPRNSGGKLVLRKPWPAMLRGLWGDPQRYKDVYWSEVKGSYFTGDGCRQDKDGYFWIVGRIDDVLNVAGHRIGTAEVESALVSHPKVAEAAVVGRPDAMKGQALVAFVTVKSGVQTGGGLREELRQHVGKEIGAVAKPDDVRFAESLPKTRSGKIMRRLLKQIAAGTEIKGDTTTLEDLSVLAKLSSAEE
jgi:acetyl-CoA synthetase